MSWVSSTSDPFCTTNFISGVQRNERIADIPEMNLGSQMETNDRSVGNLVVPFFSVVTKMRLKKYSWVKLLFSARKTFCVQEEFHEIAMQHFSFSSSSNNM